jgi:ribosomal-protein-serine acetyltransferase
MPLEEDILRIGPTTFLRPIALDDAARLFALVDANRSYLRAWLPWVDECQGEANQRTFITSAIENRQAGRGAVWLIIENGSICGVVGFNRIVPLNRAAEIGYWLDHSCQGRGVVTASVARLVRHGFEDLNLNRISVTAAVENDRSRAIPERLSFHAEGTLRQAEWLYDHFVDHVIYAQLKSEWDALMSPAPNRQSVRTINE